jgi:hypothetical protein
MSNKKKVLRYFSGLILLSILCGSVLTAYAAGTSQAEDPPITGSRLVDTRTEIFNEHQTTIYYTYEDGSVIEQNIVNGASEPPNGYEELVSTSVEVPDNAKIITGFPSYSWVFGCSAVSGAMIAGYYDRQGFPNMYTGPTNGGVMPLTDTSWKTWSDGYVTYPNNPLIASHLNVDGRATRGSIDDYWVKYGSTTNDPYITNGWTEHTWGTAIGDYMKTSQTKYGNPDGSTVLYQYNDGAKLTCADMVKYGIASKDGTYGRKLFYEKRGYTITECYNQATDNYVTSGGFTLTDYKAQIDAGNPVFISVVGHSMVGYGYGDGTTIYIRNTWDNDPSHTYTMQWGGSYEGMEMMGARIVNIKKPTTLIPTPIFPTVSVATHKPTYQWSKVPNAQAYIIQLYEGTTKKFAKLVPPTVCGTTSCSITPTWILLDGNYQWRVRAKVGGVWRPFSAFTNFNVATEFHYQFTLPSSLNKWNTAYGPWNLKNGWYRSAGLSPYSNSVFHDGLYPTFSYIVRMRRINQASNANRLILRGTVYPLDAGKHWNNEYLFQYTNDGSFSVWKYVNGTPVAIKSWTTSSAIKPYDWNKLKVMGKGHLLKFYINGELVWAGLDSDLAIGKVGAGFYKGDSSWQPLLIDYAHLFTYVPDIENGTDVWAELGETNTEWDNPNMSPPGP